jgi:hypothetical protein
MRIYNLVSPIDQGLPAAAVVKATAGQSVEFRVKPLAPADHRLQILWSVDGRSMSTAARYLLATASLAPGDHTVLVTVRDTTPFVRNDPSSVLEDSRSWTLRVAPRGATPVVRVLSPNGGEHLTPKAATTIRWEASDPDGLRRFDVSLSRDGESFTTLAGCANLGGTVRSCTWTPASTGPGFWVRVTAADAAGSTGQDMSDQPFSIETQAHRVLDRLVSLLRAIDVDFAKKRALDTRLSWAVAAEQHAHPKTMCRQLQLSVEILESPSVRQISATTALRREARKAVVTLGCS